MNSLIKGTRIPGEFCKVYAFICESYELLIFQLLQEAIEACKSNYTVKFITRNEYKKEDIMRIFKETDNKKVQKNLRLVKDSFSIEKVTVKAFKDEKYKDVNKNDIFETDVEYVTIYDRPMSIYGSDNFSIISNDGDKILVLCDICKEFEMDSTILSNYKSFDVVVRVNTDKTYKILQG